MNRLKFILSAFVFIFLVECEKPEHIPISLVTTLFIQDYSKGRSKSVPDGGRKVYHPSHKIAL